MPYDDGNCEVNRVSLGQQSCWGSPSPCKWWSARLFLIGAKVWAYAVCHSSMRSDCSIMMISSSSRWSCRMSKMLLVQKASRPIRLPHKLSYVWICATSHLMLHVPYVLPKSTAYYYSRLHSAHWKWVQGWWIAISGGSKVKKVFGDLNLLVQEGHLELFV